MKLIFLGTSAGAPTKSRNVSSLVLSWVQLGKLWLFDCGEGTQHQFHRVPVSLSKLERIFITHLHGDHVFGLPGLMASRSAAQGSESALALLGPGPLEEYIKPTLAITNTKIKYPWSVDMVEEGLVFEDDHCTVECRLLKHGIPSYGYAIVEKDQPGEFYPEKAKALGIPSGPLYGALKSGEDIILEDGRHIRSQDVVGSSRRGRKVVICGDTGVCDATVELAKGADILVHESTFMNDQTARAIEVGHSTAAQAAAAAKAAGVGQLILTHFSPRYEQETTNLLLELLKEAQEIFPNTILAHDFLTVDVPSPA